MLPAWANAADKFADPACDRASKTIPINTRRPMPAPRILQAL
jgi:hypothetical protein